MDKLRNLLAAQNWQEADTETAKLLDAAGSIDSFPCEDLRIIDRLWVDLSNGHFGFSVQEVIYQHINNRYLEIGGTRDYLKEPWEEFVNIVGWRKNNDWIAQECVFNLTAPQGHLPVLGQWSESTDDYGGRQWYGLSLGNRWWYSQVTDWNCRDVSEDNHRYFSSLMSRLATCDISE
jgi:hypothetical protein